MAGQTGNPHATSGSSYGVDLDGNRFEVEIRNGVSYIKGTNERPSIGSTIQTGGGIYRMTDNGGVKADSHNTPQGVQSQSHGFTPAGVTTQQQRQAEDARREAERQRQLELERLKQAQIAANMTQLEKSKAASLSAIKQEQAAVDPRFYESKRQTQEQSALSRRQAEEYAAAKGLSSSGLAAQSQSAISGGLQSALGALGQSQAEAHARMERAKSDLETAYQSDVAGVQAGAEAQYLQNVIDQYYKDREYQLAKEQADRQFALQEAGLTGYYQGQLTAQGQQAQLALEMGNIELAMAKLKQEALPRELELHLSDIETKLANNELDRQTAMINLEDLMNPNGVVQTAMQLQALANSLQIETLPEQTRIQLATAQAQLNSINQSTLASRVDVEYKKAQLEKLEAEIKAIQSGGYGTGESLGFSLDPKEVANDLANRHPQDRLNMLIDLANPMTIDNNGQMIDFPGYRDLLTSSTYGSLLDKAQTELNNAQADATGRGEQMLIQIYGHPQYKPITSQEIMNSLPNGISPTTPQTQSKSTTISPYVPSTAGQPHNPNNPFAGSIGEYFR